MDASEAETLALLRKNAANLVFPSQIAERTDSSRSAVANWQSRYPEFLEMALVADLHTTKVFWWPAVRDWLREHHIPFGEPALKPHVCLHCGGTVKPGELEVLVTSKKAGTKRFYHFLESDCAGALQRRSRNTTFTGKYADIGY